MGTSDKPDDDMARAAEFSCYYATLCMTDDVMIWEDGTVEISTVGIDVIDTYLDDLEELVSRARRWQAARIARNQNDQEKG